MGCRCPLSRECVDKLASFIPKKLRLELFRTIYRQCGSSPTATAKILGIHPRQVYFYLPNHTGKIRNYPNDETTQLILRAGLKIAPEKTKAILSQALDKFSELVTIIEKE